MNTDAINTPNSNTMRIAFALLIALLLVVGTILLLGFTQSRTGGFPDIPVYPNSQDWVETVEKKASKVARFATADSPDTVEQYYRSVLVKSGWKQVICCPPTYRFEGYRSSDGLDYLMNVVATPTKQGTTDVSLRLAEGSMSEPSMAP